MRTREIERFEKSAAAVRKALNQIARGVYLALEEGAPVADIWKAIYKGVGLAGHDPTQFTNYWEKR